MSNKVKSQKADRIAVFRNFLDILSMQYIHAYNVYSQNNNVM